MMKKSTLYKFCFCLVASVFVRTSIAQNFIDTYLNGQLVYTTIGTAADGLDNPRDLDFKPNSSEAWVINYANNSGGSTVIFYNAGENNQSSEYRKDTHSDHFMSFPSAIAFADNGDWACTNETQNQNFMGPALWVSDTAIYARVFQNGWATGYPLGSHTDMLHQSPYAMGIAHDTAKAYWVSDGQNGNICKYDFVSDHGPGYDDHSAGRIWRYTDVTVSRAPGIPGHMVLDKNTGWLYVVNAGAKNLFRMNTKTGSVSGNLVAPNEYLASYQAVTGASKQVIDSYASQPCGIDHYNDRLIVSDYQSGAIRIYNTSAPTPTLMGTISTGQPGIMGLKIGHDGRIWFVNRTANTLVRIDPAPATADAALSRILYPSVYNFEPNFYSPHFNYCSNVLAPVVEIVNKGASTLNSLSVAYTIDGGSPYVINWTGSLAAGATQTVELPVSQLSDGPHKIVAYTSLPNSSADHNPANDKKEASFRSRENVAALPFHEGFSAATFPPPGWAYMGYNKYCQMSREANYGSYLSDNGCLKMNNTSSPVNISGQVDYCMSPRIDLSQSSAASLDFEVAHAQYNNISNDRLELLISDDCGQSWTTIYNKSGEDLATTSPSTSVFYPQYYHWRTEFVNLDNYLGKEVILMFKTTSNYGNNVYVDNINIPLVPLGLAQTELPVLEIFPNPANSEVTVKLKAGAVHDLQVRNILGQELGGEVLTGRTSTVIQLDFSRQPSGTYFVEVATNEGRVVKKLIVQH